MDNTSFFLERIYSDNSIVTYLATISLYTNENASPPIAPYRTAQIKPEINPIAVRSKPGNPRYDSSTIFYKGTHAGSINNPKVIQITYT
ncbi:MAG: hypothetical protein E4G94_08270 [ANME-2 cluster archaeon]|nr:MAG: hypothetical protein E4G94_08270 [ANME-2 cluster archaeon]